MTIGLRVRARVRSKVKARPSCCVLRLCVDTTSEADVSVRSNPNPNKEKG